jgi:small subunit ribosomal protein S6
MRLYEVGVILRADLAEDELNTWMDTLQEWITSGGGKIVDVARWGRRRLAYPINNQNDGFYAFLKAELPSNLPAEIERQMRISESFVRYLVIRDETPEPQSET